MSMDIGFRKFCRICKHWNRNESVPACFAFPSGIPDQFWSGEQLHRAPSDGDGGVQFECVDDPFPIPDYLRARRPSR